jgi:hypothetical protein
MLTKLLAASCLMALCVTIHAGGVTWALRRLRSQPRSPHRFWHGTWLFILVALWMVLLHLVEISAWAVLYFWGRAMADLQTASYFSAVTYTTTGYGDLVLPKDWRLVGGVEALTGILMCSWSTGFFVAIVNRVFEERARASGA